MDCLVQSNTNLTMQRVVIEAAYPYETLVTYHKIKCHHIIIIIMVSPDVMLSFHFKNFNNVPTKDAKTCLVLKYAKYSFKNIQMLVFPSHSRNSHLFS